MVCYIVDALALQSLCRQYLTPHLDLLKQHGKVVCFARNKDLPGERTPNHPYTYCHTSLGLQPYPHVRWLDPPNHIRNGGSWSPRDGQVSIPGLHYEVFGLSLSADPLLLCPDEAEALQRNACTNTSGAENKQLSIVTQ